MDVDIYRAQGADQADDWAAHGDSFDLDPDVITNEYNEPVDLTPLEFDRLWLLRLYGIIDVDRYWELRVMEDDDDRTSDSQD
jgi:hypothetical protein